MNAMHVVGEGRDGGGRENPAATKKKKFFLYIIYVNGVDSLIPWF
jgi:hypothetical protein